MIGWALAAILYIGFTGGLASSIKDTDRSGWPSALGQVLAIQAVVVCMCVVIVAAAILIQRGL